MRPRFSWWLIPIIMAGAVAVDVKLLRLPVISFAALWMCTTGGIRKWKTGNRMAAVILFLSAGGWGYAGHVAGQLATTETVQCHSVAVAVHCYTQDTGKAPRRLEELVPKYLSELPQIQSPLIHRISYRRASDTEWCVSWRNGAMCNRQVSDKGCSASSAAVDASVEMP